MSVLSLTLCGRVSVEGEGVRADAAAALSAKALALLAYLAIEERPHTRDELYVVVSGNGEFVNGPGRHPFGPGDVLFVAAGVEHRFEDFTDDLVVWVVFYGPEGGEAE